MPISKSDPRFAAQALYLDYDFEEVMFRWDPVTRSRYRKLYGAAEDGPIPHDDDLYNQALLFGDEISESSYLAGKPRKVRRGFRLDK